MKRLDLTGYKVSFIIILLLSSKLVSAQEARYDLRIASDLNRVLDTVIKKRMERYHIPGFAIAVVKDGRLHWSMGYGLADLEAKTPVEAGKTIFRIGSISKLFTATAIMQLVDEGKIGLHEPINRYLDDQLSYRNDVPITPHHLLSHSEGFREISGRRTSSAATILPLQTFLKDRLIQDHYAGEMASYGTYGMALAGQLVEKLSRMPYREYLHQKIFAPLQMPLTNATDIPESYRKDLATGYEFSGGRYRKMDFEYYQTFPASDINSTVDEMANFMIMHLGNGRFNNRILLEPKTAAGMRATQYRNHPAMVGFGYGFWESTINGTKAVYHGGVMDGYAASMYLWPEKNLGVFMVCNREAPDFLSSILNNFLYYFFPTPAPAKDATAPVHSLRSNLDQFAGRYQRIDGPQLEIRLNPDSTLSFWGGRWLQIKPLLFQLTNGVLDTGEDLIAFKENEKGEIAWMTTGPFIYLKSQRRSVDDSSVLLTEQELEVFTGTYVMRGSKSFSIIRHNSKLFVSVNGGPSSELTAKSGTSFYSRENDATIRFKENRIEVDIQGNTITCAKVKSPN